MSLLISKLLNKLRVIPGMIHEEPTRPMVTPPLPGPKSQRYLSSMSEFSQDSRTVPPT